MNEREQFGKYFQFAIAKFVDRIQMMTESQVVHQLQTMKAARSNVNTTLAFLNSVSLKPTEADDREMTKLRSELNSYGRRDLHPFQLSDYLEDALKKRLETLRRNGQG
jgi:hypothetical protein